MIRRAGSATTTCSARSCEPGWRRWERRGCGRRTIGRRGHWKLAATSTPRCATRWRWGMWIASSQILRGALARSMSMSDGAADTARAVRLWLHERGAAAIETDPAWVMEMLIGLISISRPDDAPSWLERVRQAHPDADGPLTGLIEGAWGEHLANRGQPLEAIRRFGLALDAVGGAPPNVGLLALLHVATARAHIQCGQMDQARAVLQHAHEHPVGHPVADEVRNRGRRRVRGRERRRARRGGGDRPRRRGVGRCCSASAATSSGGCTPGWRWSRCTSSATSTSRHASSSRASVRTPS